MNDTQENICRLCLEDKHTEFLLLEELQLDMLKTLLIKIDFTICESKLMCLKCAKHVQTCYDFRNKSLKTKLALDSIANGQKSMKVAVEGVNSEETTHDEKKTCCVCFESDKNFSKLEAEVDTEVQYTILQYLPELKLPDVKKPSVCSGCVKILMYHFNALKKMNNSQKTIDGYCYGPEVNLRELVDHSKSIGRELYLAANGFELWDDCDVDDETVQNYFKEAAEDDYYLTLATTDWSEYYERVNTPNGEKVSVEFDNFCTILPERFTAEFTEERIKYLNQDIESGPTIGLVSLDPIGRHTNLQFSVEE